MRDHKTEAKTAYEGGATRSQMDCRFDLIPYAGVEAAARRLGLGARKHGNRNWENGGAEFAEACINHAYKHLALLAQYRRQEDIDALVCNAMMIAEFKKRGLLQEREGYNVPEGNSVNEKGLTLGSETLPKRNARTSREKESVGRKVEGGSAEPGRDNLPLAQVYCSGDATGFPD